MDASVAGLVDSLRRGEPDLDRLGLVGDPEPVAAAAAFVAAAQDPDLQRWLERWVPALLHSARPGAGAQRLRRLAQICRNKGIHFAPETFPALASVLGSSESGGERIVAAGVDERTLEGELEAAFKRGGAQRPAFDSIVKSGPNSLWPWRILAAHYDRRNRVMLDGELVIFDVGCEVDHYASDVGRTFPVSGAFTLEQEAALRVSTTAADAVIAAVRPGVTLAELQAVAEAASPRTSAPACRPASSSATTSD
ncbi:MAG: aminopeptidase P family protein [Myxococcales bacterium]|nr:aminopeptidase P family protein [Myxococcales bacterium]